MIILGSTGSIGKNALILAKKFRIQTHALACAKNYKLLNEQICEFRPKLVYIKDSNLAKLVNHDAVFSGDIAKFLKACFSEFGAQKLINAIVGFAGLKPSVCAQNLGFELCLANKESLVAGGKFLDREKIFPIDSEHFGLRFLLKNAPKIQNLIITASGGAVKKMPIKALKTLTPQIALNHPNWDMGAKITIDSATMANKLFEILEAFWLYDTKNINALIEQTSRIHAIIEFKDGSSTAHISTPDMKLAIAHALGLSEEKIVENLDLTAIRSIKFEKINLKKYPIFSLKNNVLENPDLGAVINAANEVAVGQFLRGQREFTQISAAIFSAVDKFGGVKINDLEDVFETDQKVREFIEK